MKYTTRDNETATTIDQFNSIAEAIKAVYGYIRDDKAEGTYSEDFYEIADEAGNVILTDSELGDGSVCPCCGHTIGGWKNPASAENGKKGGRPSKKEKEMSFGELVNAYDDDSQTFERYFCDQLHINPAGCFETTEEGTITTDEAYSILEFVYGGKLFIVRPMSSGIKWNGRLNSDFRISLKD